MKFIQARWLKVNFRRFWHRQQIHNALLPLSKPLVLLGRQQHVGWGVHDP